MCCSYCCTADAGGDRIELAECLTLVRGTVENFDFERYGVRVVSIDDRLDVRMETWKQCLISDVLDDVRSATYEP